CRKTMRKRFARTVKRFWEWCRDNRHVDVALQQKSLSRKLKGHYAYFGITGNFAALSGLHQAVDRAWQYWLARRSNSGLRWDAFQSLTQQHPLARPRIVHSYVAK